MKRTLVDSCLKVCPKHFFKYKYLPSNNKFDYVHQLEAMEVVTMDLEKYRTTWKHFFETSEELLKQLDFPTKPNLDDDDVELVIFNNIAAHPLIATT
mgnify:CR=1 FL=1